MEEYSDGIDNSGSLRYERTLNRDITKTIERINRAEAFTDSSKLVIDILSPIMKKEVDKMFRDVWRSKHDSHANPNNLSIAVDIVQPVIKKVHPEGDTDRYFKLHKEYPFYYLMNLKASIRFSPNADDSMKDDEAWYGKWFIDNIAPTLSRRVLGKVKTDLGMKFNNIFAFPLLDAIERKKEEDAKIKDNPNEVRKQEKIEEAMNHTLNRINVIFTPTLKFVKEDDTAGVSSRFDCTEDMLNALVFGTSMAFERIFNG